MFPFFVLPSHCFATNKISVSDDSEFSNKQKHTRTYLQASKHRQKCDLAQHRFQIISYVGTDLLLIAEFL